MPPRPVSVAQVRDAADRLLTALLETKRWDSTSWMDPFNRGAEPETQRVIEENREQNARSWVDGQRVTVERYVSAVLALDPQWFHDQAVACSSAESHIRLSIGDPPAQVAGDAQAFTGALARVERNLQQWQGEGADAFEEQVQRIRDFDAQQANLLVAAGMAMIAGREAVSSARASFVAVCDDAIAALGEYRKAESAREARVATYIVFGLVVALCTFGAGAAATAGGTLAGYAFSGAGAATAVGQGLATGNSILLTSIPSPSIDAAVAGFVANQDRVLQALDDEMADMARRFADFDREYGGDPLLLAALPPSTDVHAPGYTYDDLRSEDRPPSGAFDAALRDGATARGPAPGAIGRALEPGR